MKNVTFTYVQSNLTNKAIPPSYLPVIYLYNIIQYDAPCDTVVSDSMKNDLNMPFRIYLLASNNLITNITYKQEI